MEVERAKKTFSKVYQFDKKRLFESIKQILKKNKIRFRTVGIDYGSANINMLKALKKEFKKIRVKDVSKWLLEQREIKTEDEVKKLKKACNIAGNILEKFIKNFKKFKTESDVSFFL